MRKAIAVAGASVAFAMLAAGCTSTVHGTASAAQTSPATSRTAPASSSATSTTPTAPSSTPDAPPAGTAQLTAINLTAADLPADWTSSPSDSDSDSGDDQDQAALVACVGGTNTDPDKVTEVDSPDFSMNDADVSSSATSYKSQSDIDADVALINSPKISACYQQLLKSEVGTSLDPGSTVDAVALNITSGSSGGPNNVVGTINGTITVTDSGQQITLYLAVAFITGPKIEAEVDFESPDQPISATLFGSLVNAVATRAAAA